MLTGVDNEMSMVMLNHDIVTPISERMPIQVDLTTLNQTSSGMNRGNSNTDTIARDSVNIASDINSNFRGVWHFGDGSSVTNTDSSGNSHTLTNNNVTATTGQIYGAGSYNGTTAYMTLTPDSNLKPATLSVSMWAKFTNSISTEYPIMMGTGASIAWMWYHTGSTLYESIGNYSYYAYNSTTSWGGTWKHIVMTSSSSTNVKVYINGSLSKTGSATPTIDYTNSGEFSIGRYTGVSGYFTGVIDFR